MRALMLTLLQALSNYSLTSGSLTSGTVLECFLKFSKVLFDPAFQNLFGFSLISLFFSPTFEIVAFEISLIFRNFDRLWNVECVHSSGWTLGLSCPYSVFCCLCWWNAEETFTKSSECRKMRMWIRSRRPIENWPRTCIRTSTLTMSWRTRSSRIWELHTRLRS